MTNTYLIGELLCSNQSFDLQSDAHVCGLFSLALCGAVSRARLKDVFLGYGRRCTWMKDGEVLEKETLKGLKAMAKGVGISGCSQMNKGALIVSLRPYEKAMAYMPAEAIGQVRRYRRHLKNVKRLEECVGRETVASLLWLQNSDPPYYMKLRKDQLSDDDRFEDTLLKDIYDDRREHRMPKTHCMDAFCLSNAEMDSLPMRTYTTAPNPHSARYPMKLYLLEPVLKISVKKFGSWGAFLEARAKKQERRGEKRAQFEAKLAARKRDLVEAFEAQGLSWNEHMYRSDVQRYLNVAVNSQVPDACEFVASLVRQKAESEARALQRITQRKWSTHPRHPSVILGKRSRSPIEAAPSRGILGRQEDHRGAQSVEHLVKERNRDNIWIYRCECGYSAGMKKMRAHRRTAH